MRILLLNEKRLEREAIVRCLPRDSYAVEAVADEHAAIAAIAREAPHVLIFNSPAKGGADLARRLKGADASGQAYSIAVFETGASNREIANVVGAGVQDFVRRPIVDAELVERVRAPARVIRWAQSLTKPAVFDLSGPVDVAGLQAWKGLGGLVASDLSQIAGCAFSVSEGWPARFVGACRTATIPMSLAGDQLEVRVSIAVDEPTLKWLRDSVLCDPLAVEAATDDALREFANTAGGAVKRAALCEGVTLTTGIPFNDNAATSAGPRSCWTLRLSCDGPCIAVVGEVRSRQNQRVAATELCEGMVLAHDVRNQGGVLLVPAGARLTGVTAAKLAQTLGPRFFLEVAAPS